MRSTALYTLLFCFAFFASCSKEIIEPELYGSIQGTVTDAQTNSGISNVSIETTPATQAIVTDGNGNFELRKVATGSYLIKASKSTYDSKSVNVSVRENEAASAKIVLGGGDNASEYLKAEVTSWHQAGSTDSSSVEVEYRVTNTSSSMTFNRFEVYFDIHNNRQTLYAEVADTTLNAGESNFGSFTKNVRDAVVDSVVVAGIWVQNNQ